ncbi:hypothetical protein SXANM310S_02977 [Streptomyces xanthochromogenes]
MGVAYRAGPGVAGRLVYTPDEFEQILLRGSDVLAVM